tara:strand:+ start:702 stop:917 length:216 start_codon:yes stop_codon:yes gene_type:complete
MSDIVDKFFKDYRVPKYRQRLVAALCSSITSENDEKSKFYAEIADFEALEFSTKQVEAAKKDVRRILKIRG